MEEVLFHLSCKKRKKKKERKEIERKKKQRKNKKPKYKTINSSTSLMSPNVVRVWNTKARTDEQVTSLTDKN